MGADGICQFFLTFYVVVLLEIYFRNSAEWNVLNEAENTTLLPVMENIIKLAKLFDKQICKDH